MGKEFFFQGPLARNSLISLDLAPEMEGNGNKWKGLLGLGCGGTRIDCAWLRARGAFLKDNGFDFTEAVDRQEE